MREWIHRFRDKRLAVVISAAAALVWLIQLISVRWTISADEDSWIYMGYAWHRGDLPYRDSFENKPPGIYLVFKFVWDWFHGSPTVARLAAVLLAAVGAVLIARMALRTWKQPISFLAGPIFLTLIASPFTDGALADCESFGLFFSIVGFYLILAKEDGEISLQRAFVAGLVSGVSLLFRPQFAVDVAVLITLLLLVAQRGALRRGIVAALAATLPTLASFAYFQYHGALDDYFTVFGQAVRGSVPDAAGRLIGLKNFVHFFSFPLASVSMVLAILSMVFAPSRRERLMSVLFFGWIIAALAGILAQGWCTGHQFKHICVPLALLASATLNWMTGRWRWVAMGFVSLAAVAAIWTALPTVKRPVPAPPSGTPAAPSSESVQQVVERYTTENDRIWCYPTRGVYLRFKRLSAFRHFDDIYFSIPEAQEEAITALSSGKAKLVLINDSGLEKLLSGAYAFRSPPQFRARLDEVIKTHFKEIGIYDGWRVYLFEKTIAASSVSR